MKVVRAAVKDGLSRSGNVFIGLSGGSLVKVLL